MRALSYFCDHIHENRLHDRSRVYISFAFLTLFKWTHSNSLIYEQTTHSEKTGVPIHHLQFSSLVSSILPSLSLLKFDAIIAPKSLDHKRACMRDRLSIK